MFEKIVLRAMQAITLGLIVTGFTINLLQFSMITSW